MKLEDYTPYYNFYHALDKLIYIINGKKYDLAKEDFWFEYDIELDGFDVFNLNIFDWWGFIKVFRLIEDEMELINFMEDQLERCTDVEGITRAEWVNYTLHLFLPNTSSFLQWQRLPIEKWLVGKIEVYSKVEVVRIPKNGNPIRENFNIEWLNKNEAELKGLHRKHGNMIGSIRKVANSQGIFDEKKIESLRGSANQINFFPKL